MTKKVNFKDSQNIRLCGILSNPSEDIHRPIIILCHGFTSSKDSTTNIRLEEVLNKVNIATFLFDFFGYKDSGGDFSQITISKAVDDILQSIRYIKSLGYLKIGLLGSSFGGMAAIIAASKTSDLSLLALKSPVSDYVEVENIRRSAEDMHDWEIQGFIMHPNSLGEERRLNYSFFDDIKNNNAYERAKKIHIPTLIIHGDRDKVVPVEQSRRLSNLVENSKIEFINGADHKYINPGEFDQMINIILKFIVSHLK